MFPCWSVSEVQFQPLCSDWVNGVNGGNEYNNCVEAKYAFKTLELVSHLYSLLFKKDTCDSLKRDAEELTCDEWALPLPALVCHLFQGRPFIVIIRKPCLLNNKCFNPRLFSSFTSKYLHSLTPILFFSVCLFSRTPVWRENSK